MILHSPNYHLPDQLTKLPRWFYSRPSPPHHCFWWINKILPNQLIQSTIVFDDHPVSYPPILLVALYKIFNIFFILLYLFYPLVEFSKYLPPWNIENGGIILFGVPTSHKCITPCKFMGVNWYNYRKKVIALPCK